MENSLYVYDLAYSIAVDSAGIYVAGEVGGYTAIWCGGYWDAFMRARLCEVFI